jgi:glutathione S-transferase
MSALNLFGLERSVYTRIARLTLEEKGVAYVLNEVEVFGTNGVPQEHLNRHPFGRVPAIEHEGFWLYETAAISRYVDEAFPGPALQPSDVHARARVNQIVGLLDSYAYRPMVWGVFVERVRIPLTGGQANEAKIAESIAEAKTCLSALGALVECSPYLIGEQLTLADLHAFPILQYFSLAPEGRDLLAEHSALAQWLTSMRVRPSVRRTRTKYEARA